jgi:hypothetical protein
VIAFVHPTALQKRRTSAFFRFPFALTCTIYSVRWVAPYGAFRSKTSLESDADEQVGGRRVRKLVARSEPPMCSGIEVMNPTPVDWRTIERAWSCLMASLIAKIRKCLGLGKKS